MAFPSALEEYPLSQFMDCQVNVENEVSLYGMPTKQRLLFGLLHTSSLLNFVLSLFLSALFVFILGSWSLSLSLSLALYGLLMLYKCIYPEFAEKHSMH